jgi:dipeptidyl aminopeptidase/acylaminoacyl peptidase
VKIFKPYHYIIIFLSFFIISCGGGSGEASFTDPLNPLVEQSEQSDYFHSTSNKTHNSLNSIRARLRSISGLNLTLQYDVTTYKLEYMSTDSNNEPVKVSGLIAIPNKNSPSPLLSFQHGTTFMKADAPSFNLTVSTRHPEILFASLGYIVFSPDYIGYGVSEGETHPYLLKQPSADIVIDMLNAGKQWLKEEHIAINQQLFMTGYSQGGYVTMAALEAMQNSGDIDLTVTGAVLGAGPYDLYKTLDTLLRSLNDIPSFLENFVQETLEYFLIPRDAEIYFDRTFLDRYFDKDRQDNVHDWKPAIPLKLFHGEDDKIVPIESALSTWNTMTALGADVELIKCTASPAEHTPCVIPYLNYTINYFAGLSQDL